MQLLSTLTLHNNIVLLSTRRLPCSMVTNALLGAFTVQAEYGDYDPSEHGVGIDYLNDFEFCPGQTPELIAKIAQIHRTLRSVDTELAKTQKCFYCLIVEVILMYGITGIFVTTGLEFITIELRF